MTSFAVSKSKKLVKLSFLSGGGVGGEAFPNSVRLSSEYVTLLFHASVTLYWLLRYKVPHDKRGFA